MSDLWVHEMAGGVSGKVSRAWRARICRREPEPPGSAAAAGAKLRGDLVEVRGNAAA